MFNKQHHPTPTDINQQQPITQQHPHIRINSPITIDSQYTHHYAEPQQQQMQEDCGGGKEGNGGCRDGLAVEEQVREEFGAEGWKESGVECMRDEQAEGEQEQDQDEDEDQKYNQMQMQVQRSANQLDTLQQHNPTEANPPINPPQPTPTHIPNPTIRPAPRTKIPSRNRPRNSHNKTPPNSHQQSQSLQQIFYELITVVNRHYQILRSEGDVVNYENYGEDLDCEFQVRECKANDRVDYGTGKFGRTGVGRIRTQPRTKQSQISNIPSYQPVPNIIQNYHRINIQLTTKNINNIKQESEPICHRNTSITNTLSKETLNYKLNVLNNYGSIMNYSVHYQEDSEEQSGLMVGQKEKMGGYIYGSGNGNNNMSRCYGESMSQHSLAHSSRNIQSILPRSQKKRNQSSQTTNKQQQKQKNKNRQPENGMDKQAGKYKESQLDLQYGVMGVQIQPTCVQTTIMNIYGNRKLGVCPQFLIKQTQDCRISVTNYSQCAQPQPQNTSIDPTKPRGQPLPDKPAQLDSTYTHTHNKQTQIQQHKLYEQIQQFSVYRHEQM